MSTISAVGGSGNAWAAASTHRANHQAKMFAKVDTDGNGSVDQSELGTMLDKISQKTGASFGDTAKVFTAMDTNGDGTLSADELGKGMKSLMQASSSTVDFAQARKSGNTGGGDPDGDGDGPRGAGGPSAGPPPGGASGATATSSAGGSASSSTTYDPLDTNQDGVVSLAERLAGTTKADPLQALFKALDANSDGKISKTETDDFAKKLTDLVSQTADSATASATGSASTQGFDINKLAQMLYNKVASGLSQSTQTSALSAVA